MLKALTYVRRSASFYPMTMVYIFSVAMITVILQGWVTFTAALVLLGIFTMIAMLYAAYRELRTLNHRMAEQQEEILNRVDQMQTLLVENNLLVPEMGPREAQARKHKRRMFNGGA